MYDVYVCVCGVIEEREGKWGKGSITKTKDWQTFGLCLSVCVGSWYTD